jgi:PKD repeat protein
LASFTFTANGLAVSFTDTSTDSGGTINAWSWDFGDSTTSTQQNPQHTYAASGTYSVKETVTDSVSGAQSSKTQSVTVSNSSGTSCTTGTTGDVAGYTAICSGLMYLHNPGSTKLGPLPYTFAFVFGSNWPGTYWGDAQSFSIAGTQFLSIPFTPSPGHTIGITENQTYTGFPITFSVSTSMGLFNNGKPGNGVLCAQTNNPTLQISSNNTATNCPNLDTNTQYWFNVIPAKYSTTQGRWIQSCSGSSCQLGFGESTIN